MFFLRPKAAKNNTTYPRLLRRCENRTIIAMEFIKITLFCLLTNPHKFDINAFNMSKRMIVVYLGAKRGQYISPTPR